MTPPTPTLPTDSRRVGWIDELRDWLRRINGNVLLRLGDAVGGTRLSVRTSADAEVFGVDSLGTARGVRGLPLLMDEAPHAAVFENSWVDYLITDFAYGSYHRSFAGATLLSGLLRNGGTSTPTTMFTVPVGYRPQATYLLPALSNDAIARVDITSGGAVQFSTGTNTWFSLDSVEFVSSPQPWIAPTLTGGWANYGGSFNAAGYLKDRQGLVRLRGLISGGSNYPSVALTLPVGYRPENNEIFLCLSFDAARRVQVVPDGSVIFVGASSSWAGLDSVRFDPSTNPAAPGWVRPSFLNGWSDYGAGFAPVAYTRDATGIVRLRGMAATGTLSFTVPAFVLPEGLRPARYLHLPVIANDAIGSVRIDTSGNVVCTTASAGWMSFSGLSFRVQS